MNSVITKQLLINSLPIPDELKDNIKEYLFIDHVTVKTKNFKKNLTDTVKRFYRFEKNGYVSISHRYFFQFQSSFCKDCGGYTVIVDKFDNYFNISRPALCSCQGYIDIYFQNIGHINTPLNIYM